MTDENVTQMPEEPAEVEPAEAAEPAVEAAAEVAPAAAEPVKQVAPAEAPAAEPMAVPPAPVEAPATPAPPAPPAAPPAPPAPPYAAPAATVTPASDKNKVAAALLGILLGSLGIHKFYMGYTKEGVIMLLVSVLSFGTLAGIVGIIGLVEGILYLTKTDEEFYTMYVANKKAWF